MRVQVLPRQPSRSRAADRSRLRLGHRPCGRAADAVAGAYIHKLQTQKKKIAGGGGICVAWPGTHFAPAKWVPSR